MAEKKNSSAMSALDDNNLENVSGGRRYSYSTRYQTDDGKWVVQIEEGEWKRKLSLDGSLSHDYVECPADNAYTKTFNNEQEALNFLNQLRTAQGRL